MAPKQLFLDSLWNASDSLWHIAFFDRTKISQMVVSRYGNCLNMFLVSISLQLQMISDGSWLQKVVIWMQTFAAGKKLPLDSLYHTSVTTGLMYGANFKADLRLDSHWLLTLGPIEIGLKTKL